MAALDTCGYVNLKLHENFKCRSLVTPTMFQVLNSHTAKGYHTDLSRYRTFTALRLRISDLSTAQTQHSTKSKRATHLAT